MADNVYPSICLVNVYLINRPNDQWS